MILILQGGRINGGDSIYGFDENASFMAIPATGISSPIGREITFIGKPLTISAQKDQTLKANFSNFPALWNNLKRLLELKGMRVNCLW